VSNQYYSRVTADLARALATVVLAARNCSNLQWLSLPYLGVDMDEALASCISVPRTRLKEIVLRNHTYTYALMHTQPGSLPLFLKARRSNFVMENVTLYGLQQWHPDTLRLVKTIGRLNKAGRAYLVSDGSDKRKGTLVLSHVCDDLDCIFFHLQENASLCKR
jgi:hypothetical protein